MIDIVFASFSFRYWYGEILADQFPSLNLWAKLVFAAGLVGAVVGGSYTLILQPLSSRRLNLYVVAVTIVMALFTVPSNLLGMVSSLLARLAIDDVGSSVRTVGRFYVLSSIGSIFVTFLGGIVLFSLLKNRNDSFPDRHAGFHCIFVPNSYTKGSESHCDNVLHPTVHHYWWLVLKEVRNVLLRNRLRHNTSNT